MRNLKITVLLMVLVTGLSTAKPQNFVEQGLPTPPQLEISPAWMAEEYSRTFESQGFILRSPSLDLDSWDSLTRLQKGKKIRVVDASLKKTKGRFLDANEQQFRFKANGKVVTLDRDEVRMVSLRFGPSTGDRILLGILAGALIGASAYAEARMCEKHGCWDETYGWYEGSGKAPSARSAYIAMGVGAAGLGILAAFAETEDAVIYFQEERIATIEVATQSELDPSEPGGLEGGNVFARVTNEPDEGSRRVEE